MKHPLSITWLLLFTSVAALHAADSSDPFAPYLDGKAPEILREVPSTDVVPENITVRRVVFRSREDSEIFAVIASPKTPGETSGDVGAAWRRRERRSGEGDGLGAAWLCGRRA